MSKSNKVLAWLGPWLAFAVYVALIPAYATFYYMLPPRSFYAPYTRFEPAGMRDKVDLEKIISARIYSSSQTNILTRGEWRITFPANAVGNLELDPNGIVSFDLTAFASRYRGGHRVASFSGRNRYGFELTGRVLEMDGEPGPCRSVTALHGEVPKLEDGLTAALFAAPYPCGAAPAIKLTPDEDWVIMKFADAVETGDPSRVSEWWGRCFYLSAITITTTGFGDIVPLTANARLLCASEAVLGWIVAGIFLAVLAQTSHWPRRPEV